MRKLRKGTTVVEVVIAFAMISMSFAIGMIGIASGSNFLNSGAKLKNQQRKRPKLLMCRGVPRTISFSINRNRKGGKQMRKLVKNRKGFTLAEEVVTVLLIGILVASASGILLNAMRIFCQNVIMFNAQSKGIAVMEQLESHLAYAKTIGQQETETIAADDGCAHQVVLYVDTQDGKSELKEKGTIYYSDTDSAGTTVDKVLCKLGTYQAKILVQKVDDVTVTVDVRISRNDTVYYSETRMVKLQNRATVKATLNASDIYDSSVAASRYLYIGSLE